MYDLNVINKVFGMLYLLEKFNLSAYAHRPPANHSGFMLIHNQIITFCDRYAPSDS